MSNARRPLASTGETMFPLCVPVPFESVGSLPVHHAARPAHGPEI